MVTMLKCPNCKENLEMIKESKGLLKSGKPSKVMVDILRCKKCGKTMRENAPVEAAKYLKR